MIFQLDMVKIPEGSESWDQPNWWQLAVRRAEARLYFRLLDAIKDYKWPAQQGKWFLLVRIFPLISVFPEFVGMA